MPRQLFDYDPPERFVAGTVGEPGSPHLLPAGPIRVPVDQRGAREGPGLGTGRARQRAARRSGPPQRWRRAGAGVGPDPRLRTPPPLNTPIEEEFRVGTMSLAWDAPGAGRRRVLLDQHQTPRPTRTDTRGRRLRAAGAPDRRHGPVTFVARAQGPVPVRRPPAVPLLCRTARSPPGTSAPGPTGTGADRRPAGRPRGPRPRRPVGARGGRPRRTGAGRARGGGTAGRSQQRHPADPGPAGRDEAYCVYKPIAGERPL